MGLARRLMLPLPLSPSPPGPKITPWPFTFLLHPPRMSLIFQVSFSIGIKIGFDPHLGSILASIGTQKHWFLMGGVYKINIFTFFILNIIWTRFLIDFGLLGASKMVQKWVTWTENSHLKSVLSVKMLPRLYLGAQTDPKDLFKTLFWSPNLPLRLLQDSIFDPKIVFMHAYMHAWMHPACVDAWTHAWVHAWMHKNWF